MPTFLKITQGLLLFLLCTTASIASDTLRGKVETSAGTPAANVQVFVLKKFSGTSDEEGHFSIPYKGKLKMPLDVKIAPEQYHLNEYVFLEDENFLEVYVDAIPAKDLHVIKEEVADDKKEAKKEAKDPQEQPEVVEHPAVTELPPVIEDSLIYADDPEVTHSKNFKQYKNEINKVVDDLKEERKRIEAANKAIQDEIIRISEKLNSETNLTDEQREQLQTYILTLEKTVQENNEAFAKAQERTSSLINKLKQVIAEKDAQIAQVEQEKAKIEEKLNRNVVIFSIISFSLLLLAIVFYTIAYKMKNQKKRLIISNAEIINSRNELNERMKEMEQHRIIIEEQNEKLDIFAYKVSHDLKGPLRSIQKLTELAQNNKPAFPEAELQHINKTSGKLNKLIDDFLNISKSKEAQQYTKVDFNRLISDAIERLENLPEAKTVSIHTSIHKQIEFESDERILLSVIQNLIENAIKYQDPSKGKRSINVTIKQVGDTEVALEVEDNGLGISEEKLPHIFDMFYKVNPESNGSGLGLYITKNNVEKLGGKLEVESKEGAGSRFTSRFSLSKTECTA